MRIEQRPASEIKRIENPIFRKALCVKPGFRYSALKPYCQEIEFITDGFATDIDELSLQIIEAMTHYNPDEDVLVPTGTGIVNILLGYYIANKHPGSSIAVAFFRKEITKYNRQVIPEDYEFYKFHPATTMKLWV
jgi:hypothetical protein